MTAEVYAFNKPKGKVWERVSHNLVKHVPSGVYYVRKFKAGKGELFKTTGAKTKARAQTIADQMVSDWLGERLKTKRSMTLGEVIPRVDEQLQKEFENGDRDAVTREHDRAYLKVIDGYFGDVLLEDLDEQYWEDWIRENAKTSGRETFFDVAKYLSIAFTRAFRMKLISRKPKFKNPDKPKPFSMEKVVSPAETQAIARELIRQGNEWLLLQLLLGAECGNRTGEVRTLRWEMIEFERNDAGDMAAIIRFHLDKANRKKGKGREFQASEQVGRMLWERFKKRDKASPYVFPRPTDGSHPQTAVYQNRAWRGALRSAGVTRPIWFYWLRHTFYTTALLEAEMPIQQVSEFGGTSIRTLQRVYLHADAKRTSRVASAVRVDLTRGKLVKEKGEEE